MSGLAAVYHRDGRPAAPDVLRRMLDAGAHRGPDTIGTRCVGPVALGHVLLRTTPESLVERQPVANDRGTTWISFDGRLDNRSDLAGRITGLSAHDSDAAIALRAYEACGPEAFALFVGDFAALVWDSERETLVCARDPLGIRPLCYAESGTTFVCASEIKQLFASAAVRPSPNPGFVGELLSYRPTSLEETLYAGVMRVPPAHVLTVTPHAITATRFFDFAPQDEIRYATDMEYAEHFHAVFQRAVADRLRAIGRVDVFLSGGLDSSSIAGMAAATMRSSPARLQLGLLSVRSSHPDADERLYADEVARMWRLPMMTTPAERAMWPTTAETVHRELDFPDQPNTAPWASLLERARDMGGRVTLWGHGGDEWLTGDAAHCADLLARGRPGAALRQLREDLALARGWGGGGVSWRDAVRWTLVPLMPRPLKRLVRRFQQSPVPPWIDRRFASKIDLASRLRAPRPLVRRFPTTEQQHIYAQVDNGWSVLERELHDRFCARFSSEPRFPFHDRRLIAFALALPWSQRWRGGETKIVLRRACGDLLPASVRSRRTKGDFSYLFASMIAREGRDRFTGLRLVADGYLNPVETQRIYDRYRSGSRRDLDALWIIHTMESWYSTMFEGGSVDGSIEARGRVPQHGCVA